MSTTISMPKLGLTMTEGTVSQWSKSVGDTVKEGDQLFVVSTDKITYEVLAESDGILASILVNEGEDAPVAAPIAILADPGEDISAIATPEVAPEPETSEAPAPKTESETVSGKKKVTVIGGGPGGYVCAIKLAQLGAEVTLIERDLMGGTCLNWGCIPTKVLVHTAELYEETKTASDLGLDVSGVTINWPSLMNRKEAVVGQMVGGVEGLMKANKIKIIRGEASFVSGKTLEVNGQKIESDSVVIASGSETVIPPIPGADLDSVVTSKEALSFNGVPESLTVVGGGVIGMEFASLYATMGTKVTVVEMLDKVLPMIDQEIASVVRNRMEKAGVVFYTSSKVMAFETGSTGTITKIETSDGALDIESTRILLSVGRKACTASLKLENSGVKTERGRIVVDSTMATSVPGIYSIGDCSSKIQLAHVASAEGEIAAENIMGQSKDMDYKTVPSCVYTLPEIASVGLTEEEALKQGYSVKTGKFALSGNGKSVIMNNFDGMVKIVVNKKYDEILGVHIVGPRATALIVEGALALRLEATVEELVTTIHAHPTVGEALAEAALDVDGRAIHMPPKS